MQKRFLFLTLHLLFLRTPFNKKEKGWDNLRLFLKNLPAWGMPSRHSNEQNKNKEDSNPYVQRVLIVGTRIPPEWMSGFIISWERAYSRRTKNIWITTSAFDVLDVVVVAKSAYPFQAITLIVYCGIWSSCCIYQSRAFVGVINFGVRVLCCRHRKALVSFLCESLACSEFAPVGVTAAVLIQRAITHSLWWSTSNTGIYWCWSQGCYLTEWLGCNCTKRVNFIYICIVTSLGSNKINLNSYEKNNQQLDPSFHFVLYQLTN